MRAGLGMVKCELPNEAGALENMIQDIWVIGISNCKVLVLYADSTK